MLSVTSSNMTASDLAGPGRTLGKLYAFLGLRLEFLLNGIFTEMLGVEEEATGGFAEFVATGFGCAVPFVFRG